MVFLFGCNAPPDGSPVGSFKPVTAVYDCVARERPFSIVTQTAEDGLHIWVPEPFSARYVLLERVEVASGERYEHDGITAWSKGDEAMFEIDDIRVTECELNRRESIWEAAMLNGVDFRAVGNEPGWVLEISERTKLLFRYDYDASVIEATASEISPDPEASETVFTANTASGLLVITLRGQICSDTMIDESYETAVSIELGDRSFLGCGRALH
jgi:membrane-bound inhibitor of C-type lysozyme